jgi:hypothetical protein
MNNKNNNFHTKSGEKEHQAGMKIPNQLVTAGGEIIFISDEMMDHLQAHPDVIEFLNEAASRLDIKDKTGHFEEGVNMGRIIGISGLVQTETISLNQKTYFANRISRDFPCRIDPESKGNACDNITIAIKFDEKSKTYNLLTAYIGFPCPDLPYDVPDRNGDDYRKSLDFWCQHALTYDENVMGLIFESTWEEVLKESKVN